MPTRTVAATTFLLLAIHALTACGAGGLDVPPPARAPAFLPSSAIPSEAPMVFVIQGLGAIPTTEAATVSFEALEGTPFLDGTTDRVTVQAVRDGPGQLRGALPSLAVPWDRAPVVEARVAVAFADGAVVTHDALRARFAPVPAPQAPTVDALEPTLLLSGAPTPFLVHGAGFGEVGDRVAITLQAAEGEPFRGADATRLVAPGWVLGDGTVQGLLPAAAVRDDALVRVHVDLPGGRRASSATALGRVARERPLIATRADAFDHAGAAVAVDGDTIVVGACLADTPASGAGAVDVHVRDDTGWHASARLLAPDAHAGDEFGSAVALDGDTLAVGAPYHDGGASNGGAVYVFVRTKGAWSHQQTLTADDAAAGDHLGASVALRGDVLVAGAPDENNASGTDAGAVYVFTRVAGAWSQAQKLFTASVPARAYFGHALALSADTLVVGAPGADLAFAFTPVTGGFGTQRFLGPPGPGSDASFGWSVALDGPRLLVGAPEAGGHGRVHAFERVAGDWTHREQLEPPGGAAGDGFGWSVALAGSIVLAGAPHADAVPPEGGSPIAGAGLVHPYRRRADGSLQAAPPVVAGDAAPHDAFGWAVALDGPWAVVGAPRDNHAAGTDAGSAYIK